MKFEKNATSTRQFLQRNLPACDIKTKDATYTTYIRPKLEYASTVWDPHTCANMKHQRDALEDAQTKSARYVTGQWKRRTSVTDMKANLKWESLQQRRAKARLLMMHSIKHQAVAIPSFLLVPKITTTMVTRGAATKHHVPNARIVARERSFMVATPIMWDGLSPDITAETDHDSFRALLCPVVVIV